MLAIRERSNRAYHLIFLRACHAQGTRTDHLVRVQHSYEMSADPISCSWKPLKLNTANCAQGRGKMQVSFSHVGTGGARKTPPLSLGTWPTEGKGYEEALRWYDKVQRTLEPLRGKVGSDDEGVQKIKLQCQQAAKAACAQADPAKVCLVRNVLCSAYPQPTLSLPSHAFLLGRLVALLLLAFRVIAPSIASMVEARVQAVRRRRSQRRHRRPSRRGRQHRQGQGLS